MTNESNAIYAYCIVKLEGTPAPVPRTLKGLEKCSRPRLVDATGGFYVVASDAPLAVYAAEAIDAKLRDIDWVSARAAEHDGVVERATKMGTVVPLKLFTLFSSEERALAHVKKMRRSLERIVARVAECDEWSLRVVLDEARAAKVTAERAERIRSGAVSGTNFLQRKKTEQERMRKLGATAKVEIDSLFLRLEEASKRAVRRAAPSRDLAGRVLLDAAFLVPRGDEASFKAVVSRVAPGLADEGHHVTLSGPWPAYSFVEAS